MTNRYQIPAHNEEPSTEMVEWLHENAENWEGNDTGIVLYHDDGSAETGFPGDWLVRDEAGRYSVERKA